MDNSIANLHISTEEKIKEAARRVFLQKGLAGARMQEIADEAGINKALLHYYFRSKDKLFEQIFQESFGRLLPQLSEVFSRPVSIFTKIEHFVDSYINLLSLHPYLPVFVLSEINRNPTDFFARFVNPDMQAGIREIEKQFQEAAQQQIINHTHPRQLLINMMSLCVFPFAAKPMLQHLLPMDDAAFDELIAQRKTAVSAFIINAIKPTNK